MTTWTAPDVASLRGDNSRPLQKIFGSLTEYLKHFETTIIDEVISQSSETFVRNGESTTLTIGTVVYLDAQQGDRATVKRAFNTSDATSAKTLGVVAESIAPNADGLVTTLGYLEKVNTSAFTAGQTLYLGATAGTFTATKPVAPNHMVYVGVVIRANAGNGIIYVRCQNGYELDEIHDVLITSPATGNILMRNGSNLWINTPQTSITSVGTLTAGTVPASLLSGTVDTARISGSYTGITGVGTITTGTWSGSFGAVSGANLTTLNASNISSGTLNNARLPAAATTITSVGTLTGLSVNGSNAGSPVATIGDWDQDGRFTAFRSQYGYLLLGSTSVPNANIYLRTETASGTVIIGGGANNNVMTVGATDVSMTGGMNAYSIRGNANVAGTGNASYHPSGIYSTGSNWLYGTTFLNGGNIGDTSTTVTGAGTIYANNWFRSWGDTGWYNQSYGGGVYMVDTTFVRIYNSKIFYAAGGIWSVDTGTASTTGFQYLLRGTTYGNYAPFTSMREAKRNIETISNSGLLIDQLNPVTFQEQLTDQDDEISTAWKDADLEYGFIADEVAQVGTGHLAQYKSMDDGTLKPVGWSFHGVVSVLVAEVKDLRSRLKALEGAK